MNKERKGFCKQFFFSPHIVLKKENDAWNTDINTWTKSWKKKSKRTSYQKMKAP